jgi:apolipoprotein N-acyltransferase
MAILMGPLKFKCEQMYINLKKFMPFFITLLAGAALPLAFAPHHIALLGILSPALLLSAWNKATPTAAFCLGYCFGIGLFGMGISWVYISIHDYGNTDAPLAAFITGLLVLILALYPALQGYLLKKTYKKPNAWLWFIGFPSSWVLFEWLRGWVFTGFPWLYLGYSQIDTLVGHYAPLGSVFGISWLVALSAACLFTLVQSTLYLKLVSTVLLALIWGGGFLLQNQTWTTTLGSPQTVSLVQGNVDPLHKFAQNNPIQATEALYGQLSRSEWGRDIIVWPENAIPLPLPYSKTYIDKLNARAEASNSTLITGIQWALIDHSNDANVEPTAFYNSITAVGAGSGIYHKCHLVPFGEFLPFDKQLRGLIGFFNIPMSSFIEGPCNQSLIQSKNLKLLPLICYEIAFPELVRVSVPKSQVMVNISEDGWFGTSWGPHQHLEIARMRAKETGRPLLRATTSGISAIINDKGNIIARSPQFQAMILQGTVQGTTGETPWVQIGLGPLLCTLLGIFIIGSILSHRLGRR